MSRIGKLPIDIPAKVKVEIKERHVRAEGPQGKLSLDLPPRTSAKIEANQVIVSREGEDARSKAMHGLGRSLVNNMLIGVSDGYVKKLEIHGVGFKASVQNKIVNMALGYSHPINYPIPDQVTVTVEDNTKVTVAGPDKQKVGQVASELRSFYPPEPYKGKGVRYAGEQILRKEGKTVQ